MSEYIVSIIPAKSTGEIDGEILEQCIDVITEALYNKILLGTKEINIEEWSIEIVRNQIEAKAFSQYCLFAPTLIEYPSECKDYLDIVCKICQKDVRKWWAIVMQLDSQRQDYFVNGLLHSCPCGQTKIDLTDLDYRANPMYYIKFSIRVWHLFSLFTRLEIQKLMHELEKITGKQLMILEGNY